MLLAYLGFPFYDIATLPLLSVGGQDEFQPIKVDRIAPEDAATIREGGAQATLSVRAWQRSAVTGRGTGVDDERFEQKIRAIEQALQVNRPDSTDGIDLLRTVGGFEIGVLAGVYLAAAAEGIPAVIDGLISGAAALVAAAIAPDTRDALIASHRSAEPGHTATLEHLRLEPMLELGMRLGEGSGAALGISLCVAACRVLDEMATFAEAGVSDSDEAVEPEP